MESGFEPGSLCPPKLGLITKPLWPPASASTPHKVFLQSNRGRGRCGLVAASRLRHRRMQDSKHDSKENLLYMRACCTLNQMLWSDVLPLVSCGSLKRRCHPRHLTTVQNYEVCPKIALVFL
ncbi:hypothetical protein AVEN_193197-1 [Araneus ventricosus]|uniref:Uncharacterized protein n=1 Tax=Araneus ventricosus TaxID=182803 RepID=A0A4Y2B102_ARAVE|nr:hypothetical protein AVEN_193197-1 [Araneus ventricosus]